MSHPASLEDACHSSLESCLHTLADHCPDLPANAPPLHRLRNLMIVLMATPAGRPRPRTPEMTLDGALTLVSTAQALLEALRHAGSSGRVEGEMYQALSETLAALSDQIGAALRQRQAGRVRGLYVIIDPQVTGGRDPMDIARAAVRGGARMLQLRDKLGDKGQTLPLAMSLQQLCRANDVDLIVNDQVDLAAALGTTGVHVGQTDLPVAQARRVLSPHQVIGRSNHDLDELLESQEMGADHVAFGAIYSTTSKTVSRPPQGTDLLRRAKQVSRVPLVAIGGITAENVAPVVEAGADAICVTAAVAAAPEPEAAAARLVQAIREAGGRV